VQYPKSVTIEELTPTTVKISVKKLPQESKRPDSGDGAVQRKAERPG
jgi:hypothetical protein